MSGLYLQHKIHFTQAGSGYPVISSFTSNLIVNADWFNPIHEDTGECSLTIFTDAISLNPVREKQSFSVSSLTINRFPFLDFNIDLHYLNIYFQDSTGNFADDFAGVLECRIPFYFENTVEQKF